MKVTVNGQVFDDKMCMIQAQRISQEMPGISEKDAKKQVSDGIIKHVLLSEHAQKEVGEVPAKQVDKEFNNFKSNYPSEAEFQKMCQMNRVTEDVIKKDMEQSMRINMFVQKLAKTIPPAPKKVIEEYYKRDHKLGNKPKEVHAAHIVKKITPQTAEQVFKEMCELRKILLDGADFAKLADEHSGCDDAGGDLGWFSRGRMVEEFDVILFSMNKGEISPVFQTQFGYHIATIYDEKAEKRISLEECEEEVKAVIKHKMTEECVDKWLENVKSEAEILIEN